MKTVDRLKRILRFGHLSTRKFCKRINIQETYFHRFDKMGPENYNTAHKVIVRLLNKVEKKEGNIPELISGMRNDIITDVRSDLMNGIIPYCKEEISKNELLQKELRVESRKIMRRINNKKTGELVRDLKKCHNGMFECSTIIKVNVDILKTLDRAFHKHPPISLPVSVY